MRFWPTYQMKYLCIFIYFFVTENYMQENVDHQKNKFVLFALDNVCSYYVPYVKKNHGNRPRTGQDLPI